jgi:DNA-binding protein
MITKTDFITKIAEEHSLSKAAAGRIFEDIFSTIEDEVAKEGKCSISGFGTFEARKRTSRTGRNPRTGETIEIPASVGIGFKAGKAFKERLNK